MYSDLDERNITELSKFDASVALEILEHYCSGDLSQVRNRRAYLAGTQLGDKRLGVRAVLVATAGPVAGLRTVWGAYNTCPPSALQQTCIG